MLKFEISTDFNRYRHLIDELSSKDELGPEFSYAMSIWCGLEDADIAPLLWRIWLLKHKSGKDIGVCGLYDIGNPSELWLGWLGIIREFRGHGYAREAVNQMAKISKLISAKFLYLWHDHNQGHLTKFYEKLGFELAGTAKQYMDDKTSCHFLDKRDIVLRMAL